MVGAEAVRTLAVILFVAAVILFAFLLPMKANEFARECRANGGAPIRGYEGLVCAAINTVGTTPK